MEIKLAFKIAIINSWTAWEKKRTKTFRLKHLKLYSETIIPERCFMEKL